LKADPNITVPKRKALHRKLAAVPPRRLPDGSGHSRSVLCPTPWSRSPPALRTMLAVLGSLGDCRVESSARNSRRIVGVVQRQGVAVRLLNLAASSGISMVRYYYHLLPLRLGSTFLPLTVPLTAYKKGLDLSYKTIIMRQPDCKETTRLIRCLCLSYKVPIRILSDGCLIRPLGSSALRTFPTCSDFSDTEESPRK
jgi:hypothetical protein